MLTARMLNPAATLNSFRVLDSVDYVAGASLSLVFQIWDSVEDYRFVPPAVCVPKVTFYNNDGSTFQASGTVLADDRSIFSINLSPAQTANLIGGNLLLTLDLLNDGTQLKQGFIIGALQQITIDS